MDPVEARTYSILLIAAVLVSVLIVFFAVSVIRNQRQFVRLQRSYFLNEINLLEGERTRIARDLHDELGSLLSITKLLVSDVVALTPKGQQQLKKAGGHLELILLRTGEICIDLTPNSLLRKGFLFALQDYLADVKEVATLSVDFRYQVQTEPPPSFSIHLYRIIRELVHNCLKHAGASRLLLHLTESQQWLSIRYQDNGKGFATSFHPDTATGLGMCSIRNRTRMLGGRLHHRSAPGKGSYFLIQIPLYGLSRS